MKKIGMLVGAMWAVLALVGCKKEAALTQAGDINLAGCEVPAGLTSAQAEAVSCTPAQAEPQINAGTSTAASDESVINEALARDAFIFNQSEGFTPVFTDTYEKADRGLRSVHVEAKEVQRRVQARCY